MADDASWMLHAVALARRARPSPNPRVGAVVVRDGVAIGEGWHAAAGTEHAEVVALRAAGERARGATVYVTLEPCNHHGRTPPCTDALIHANVARVVVGVRDPNPEVAGGGIERMTSAGIDVHVGAAGDACGELVRAWSRFVTTGLPRVVLKSAMTLDARTAARDGTSRWITGPEARRDVHAQRASCDAVAVGIGTVLADDPKLTVRDAPLAGPAPVRVVFDSTLRTPLESALVATVDEAPLLIVHARDADERRGESLRARGAELLAADRGTDGRIALDPVLRKLAARGIVELLVEGGATLHAAFLDADRASRIVCYIAPMLLNDAQALAAFGGGNARALDAAVRLGPLSVTVLGNDIRVDAEVLDVHRDRHGSR